MSDFGTMISRIERELRRDNLTADIKDAIRSSIDNYAAERFWFNEEEASANLTTGITALSLPADFREMDRLEILINGDRKQRLVQRTIEYIRAQDPEATTGIPTEYAIYADQIYFDTSALSAYPLSSLYQRDLTDISASASSADTNSWMTDGETMIRQKAKSIVARDRLRNYELADQMEAEAYKAWLKLKQKTSKEIQTNQIQRHAF